jgi:hypothetical protein
VYKRQVFNKESGYSWSSRPTEQEMSLEESNQIWMDNLVSPIVFGYINDFASSDVKYGNVANQDTVITIYSLDDGVRVYFEFKATGITMGYDIRLKTDHIEVTMPSYLISDPGEKFITNNVGQKILDKKNTFILTEISLFPFLGAARGDAGERGYLFVPDGNGGLMNFDSSKLINSQFLGHIYGADISIYNNYDNTLRAEFSRPTIKFPVYGIVRGDNSMMAIIDEGETQADIIGSKAGVQTGFHSVNSRFTYRMKYKIITNTVTGNGYFTFSKFSINEERKLNFYFDSGEDADYVSMAKTYRQYLMEKNGLQKLDEDGSTSLQLNIVGGDVEIGLLGKKFISVTAFSEAEDILKYLKDSGIENVDVTYLGWTKHGLSVDFPDRFPIPRQLGGEKGLTALAGTTKQLGYKLYLRDDNLRLLTGKGIRLRRDTVYNIQDNTLFNGSFANVNYIKSHINQIIDDYQKIGVDGIQERSLGYFLYSDFNKNNPMSRKETKNKYIEMLRYIIDRYGSLRIDVPNAYLLSSGMTITYMPSRSYFTLIDENVPFYPIAVHGLVDYVCGDYNNEFYEPKTQLLEAVEMGGNISFTVSKNPTEVLKKTLSSYFYSTEFELWKDIILKEYNRLELYLSATEGKFIDDYRKINDNLVKVSYEGGTIVIVNYSDEDMNYDDNTVPAGDFIVLIGG